jgi:hypothetical protein
LFHRAETVREGTVHAAGDDRITPLYEAVSTVLEASEKDDPDATPEAPGPRQAARALDVREDHDPLWPGAAATVPGL